CHGAHSRRRWLVGFLALLLLRGSTIPRLAGRPLTAARRASTKQPGPWRGRGGARNSPPSPIRGEGKEPPDAVRTRWKTARTDAADRLLFHPAAVRESDHADESGHRARAEVDEGPIRNCQDDGERLFARQRTSIPAAHTHRPGQPVPFLHRHFGGDGPRGT